MVKTFMTLLVAVLVCLAMPSMAWLGEPGLSPPAIAVPAMSPIDATPVPEKTTFESVVLTVDAMPNQMPPQTAQSDSAGVQMTAHYRATDFKTRFNEVETGDGPSHLQATEDKATARCILPASL